MDEEPKLAKFTLKGDMGPWVASVSRNPAIEQFKAERFAEYLADQSDPEALLALYEQFYKDRPEHYKNCKCF